MNTIFQYQKKLLLQTLTLLLFLALIQSNILIVVAQDSELPMVSILSPQATRYSNTIIDLNFTISEPPSLIQYIVDGTNNITITGNTTLILTEGTHNVTVYVTDLDENTVASNTITFTVLLPPVVTIISPSSTTYSNATIELIIAINKPSRIQYVLDNAYNITIAGNSTLKLSEGNHNVTVYATDMEHSYLTGKSEVITFNVDITPPVVKIDSPLSSKIYNINNVTLTVTTDEPAILKYRLDNGMNVSFISPITVYGLTNGQHVLRIYADDLFGNSNVTEYLVFRVDYERPLEPLEKIVSVLIIFVGISSIMYVGYKTKH